MHETRLLTRHPWVPRRILNVAEYRRMGEVGILAEHDRVELIEGEIVIMAPMIAPSLSQISLYSQGGLIIIGTRPQVRQM
jgi:hypothetical protein